MMRMSRPTMLVAAGLLVLPAVASAEATFAPLERIVRVEVTRSSDAEISGVLVNRSDDQLEDVRLIVTDEFAWRNERHPGPESPGDGYTFVVRGPIPPGGSVPFTFERPAPLPTRADGDFTTQVAALELTRRPLPGAGSGPAGSARTDVERVE